MQRHIETIFMCQRHQLVRWGKFSGYLGIGFGLVLCLTSIVAFFILVPILTHVQLVKDDRTERIVLGAKGAEELRWYAMQNQYHAQRVQLRLLDSFRAFAIVLSGAAILLISYGVLSLKARELAIAMNKAEQATSADRHQPSDSNPLLPCRPAAE